GDFLGIPVETPRFDALSFSSKLSQRREIHTLDCHTSRSPRVKMATAESGHEFNSDLLANEHDRDKVRDLYSPLEDILYHPELIDTFGKYNVVADDAKKRSRTL